jgi:glucosyl-dolichyl phosphate glucuronosyltransferase
MDQPAVRKRRVAGITFADGLGVTPRISVVISTYNRAALLSQAIERLASQQATVAFEVIVIDNNSNDETARVIGDAVRRHPDIVRTGFEARQGVSYGRNAGIALSRGSIVAFTDDDVLVTAGWVDTIAEALAREPGVDCVGGRVLPVWHTPPPAWLTPEHWSPLALVDYGDEPFRVDHDRRVCLVTANVAYRRAALDAIGWFSPDFPRCQDHELLLRLWRAGRSGMYLPSLVVTCDVPESRLAWSYHRRWHADHGRFCAKMNDDEAGPHSGPSGEAGPVVFGAAGSLYRGLAQNAGRYVFARLLLRHDAARQAEVSLLHRAAFISTRATAWRREHGVHAAAGELVRFLLEWLRTTPRRAWPAVSTGGRERAYALIAFLVGGSAYDILIDREHWPFSQYPMFSDIQTSREFTSLRLYGVISGSGSEIPLLDSALIGPMDQCRLSTALSWISRTPDADQRLADVLRTTYDRYERRRLSGEHDGPPLDSIRLYRNYWTLQTDASPHDRPDMREFVMALDQQRAATETP